MKTVSDNSGDGLTRRRFLANTSAFGASSLGLPRAAAAEPPPEIRRIRLVKIPAICLAPEYLAEELLRLEGFAEVEYAEFALGGAQQMLFANRADVTVSSPPEVLPALDAGKPLVLLAGIHGGCYELFANERIPALRDLKGKRVAVSASNPPSTTSSPVSWRTSARIPARISTGSWGKHPTEPCGCS
jgi:NitT/TauT family transport system substrate-binding protein